MEPETLSLTLLRRYVTEVGSNTRAKALLRRVATTSRQRQTRKRPAVAPVQK